MRQETIELIEKAVRGILANTDLGKAKVESIVAGEVADPFSWGNPEYAGDDAEWPVKNFYSNIKAQVPFTWFVDRLAAKYGVSYFKHLKK